MSDINIGDIGEKIQEAIDSQDYSDLSSTLENLVTDAVTSALGELGDNVNKAADIIAGRVTIDRRPEYMKQKTHTVVPPQNPWMSEFDKMAGNYFTGKDMNQENLFSTGGISRWKGYLFAIAGLGGVMGCVAGLLILLITSAFTHVGMVPAQIFLAVLAVIFGVMAGKGFKILNKLRRFKNYLKVIGKRCVVSVRELAGANQKTEKQTLKDIKDMIDDNMFIQGKLDPSGENLYITKKAYEEYLDEMKQKLDRSEFEELQKLRQMQAEQKESEILDSLPPEVQKMLLDGAGYLQMLEGSNDAISDEAVSQKIGSLQAMTSKIFDYVKDHPEAASGTKKLMKYYLPTTQKLLDSYQQLTEAEQSGLHPDQIPNIQKSKREIEETLDTLNQAFARLFDNLYEDTSMNISADISVLNTLLAEEGLVGADIMKQEVKKEEKGQVMTF